LLKTKQLLLQASKTYPSPHRNTMPLKAAAACLLLPAAPCCCLLLVQLLVAAAAVVLLQSNSLQSKKQTARHPFRNIRNSKTTPNFVPKT
jgi:hypothetical protein